MKLSLRCRTMPETVLYEVEGRVATLTLNRPDRLNAIVPALIRDLDAALDRAQEDDGVHAIRLRGAGRVFCAGYDIDWGSEAMVTDADAPWDPIRDYHVMSRFVRAYMRLWESPKPVIAQVHGFCVGGGTDFALCSDLIVCADDAYIGYPPARVWGSPTTSMWVYRLGLERCKRLMLTGDALDGRRAVEWGLACESAPADELDEAALALARRVALLPPNQLHTMKLLPGLRADGPARDPAHPPAARRRCPPHPRGGGVLASRPGVGRRRRGRARCAVWRLRAAEALTAPIGVVLAAGSSSRLDGEGKASLELAGRPMLAYVLKAMIGALDDVAVAAQASTALPGVSDGETLRVPGMSERVALWTEPDRPRQSLAGLRHALQHAGDRPVLACAVDLPLVTPALV